MPYNPGTDDVKLAEASVRTLEGSEGLPVCVQVVGLPWREEVVLRTMSEIETALAVSTSAIAASHSKINLVPRHTLKLGSAPVGKSRL